MNSRRIRNAVAALGCVALFIAPQTTATAATLGAEVTFTPQPALVNEQLVTAQLDPGGLPNKTEIINRIVANNLSVPDVKAETSTVDLRFLDHSGAPEVIGNSVVYPVGGSGQTSVATEASFNKPLPIALHAEYSTPGPGEKGISPTEVNGTSGDMSITYTVTNTTVKKQEITYRDAAGNETTTVEPVFAPFVGTLIATLAPGVELTSAGTGIVNTTRDGTTSIQWNLMLYPPMGDYQQQLKFKVTGTSLTVPQVLMQAVPVTTTQDPAVGFSANLLSQSLAGSTKLAGGLTTLNNSTAELARGAAQLTEAQAAAARGTAQAASGSAGITVGAARLTAGLTGLSTALDEFAGPQGLPKAAVSTGEIADAVNELVTAIGTSSDAPIPPTPPYPTSLTLVQAARVAEQATAALRTVAASGAANDAAALVALVAASARLCTPPVAGCTELAAGISQVQQAAVKSAGVAAGLQLLNSQVLTKITAGIISVSTALKSNSGQSIYGALRELQAGLIAASGIAKTLAAGSESATDGAGHLTDSSGKLTNGLDELSAGSKKLVAGSQKLATGADALQKDGTSQILHSVIDSSTEPSLANSYLKASSARAANATPYPPPPGAVGRIAYTYVLQTPAPTPSLNPAAIGIALVAVAAFTLVAIRRLRAPTPT